MTTPTRPQRINKERQKFKTVLKEYLQTKAEFICEVPKV